jgi:cell division protein FtsW (lipid II flippase)
VFCFPPTNYSHRWIPLVFIKIQPSEFAKIAFILAVSHYLATRENCRRLQDLAIPLLLAVVPMLLILLEPDIGMALVFLPVLFAMLAAADARRFHGVLILAVGLAFIPVAWKHLGTDHKARVIALFEQPLPNETPSKDAYQLHQAKQMRAMGGLWGSYWTGPYSENRADYHLPESENDFIVCVLGERFGLPGLAILLVLFAFLFWRAAEIALAAPDSFGRLTAIGIATLFAIEMLINVGMSVGLVPITGLALPFLSYGGSNLLAHALAVGLLINIGIRSGPDFQPVVA